MKPKIVTSVFVRVYQNKLGRLIVRTFGRPVLSVTGCPVRPDNMDRVILSATTMVYSRFHQVSFGGKEMKKAERGSQTNSAAVVAAAGLTQK